MAEQTVAEEMNTVTEPAGETTGQEQPATPSEQTVSPEVKPDVSHETAKQEPEVANEPYVSPIDHTRELDLYKSKLGRKVKTVDDKIGDLESKFTRVLGKLEKIVPEDETDNYSDSVDVRNSEELKIHAERTRIIEQQKREEEERINSEFNEYREKYEAAYLETFNKLTKNNKYGKEIHNEMISNFNKRYVPDIKVANPIADAELNFLKAEKSFLSKRNPMPGMIKGAILDSGAGARVVNKVNVSLTEEELFFQKQWGMSVDDIVAARKRKRA